MKTVITLSAPLFIGSGDKLDKKEGAALGMGGYALMPGAFQYVNPSDDPRRHTN